MLDLKITFKLNIVCLLIRVLSCSRLKNECGILYAELKAAKLTKSTPKMINYLMLISLC